jgi:hypothetical protein
VDQSGQKIELETKKKDQDQYSHYNMYLGQPMEQYTTGYADGFERGWIAAIQMFSEDSEAKEHE